MSRVLGPSPLIIDRRSRLITDYQFDETTYTAHNLDNAIGPARNFKPFVAVQPGRSHPAPNSLGDNPSWRTRTTLSRKREKTLGATVSSSPTKIPSNKSHEPSALKSPPNVFNTSRETIQVYWLQANSACGGSFFITSV